MIHEAHLHFLADIFDVFLLALEDSRAIAERSTLRALRLKIKQNNRITAEEHKMRGRLMPMMCNIDVHGSFIVFHSSIFFSVLNFIIYRSSF